MKKGQASLMESTILHPLFLGVFIVVAVVLFAMMKSYAVIEYDFSKIYAESVTDSLASCLERDGKFSLLNMRLCDEETTISNYAAKIIVNGEVGYFNKVLYGSNPLCLNKNSRHVCGYRESYDGFGNNLRIEWVYRDAQ